MTAFTQGVTTADNHNFQPRHDGPLSELLQVVFDIPWVSKNSRETLYAVWRI